MERIEKIRIAFFDTKPYDRRWFDACNKEYEIIYYEGKLNKHTVGITKGFQVVCVFVNDDINKEVVDALVENGVKLIALRCAGFSNVDLNVAKDRIPVVRVPAYSPYAVAEFAMGLLLTLNRKIHKSYNRTREYNYNINGLSGMDLHEKTAGVIGTGKIGRVFIRICQGFGMKVLAYDPYPAKDVDFTYVDLDTLFRESDVISLHCPLTEQTKYIINREAISKMKSHTIIVNTSRGQLIESHALLDALQEKKLGGAALDVYEEEADYFFEDHSERGIHDAILQLLTSLPNVLVTSHQAFLTEEALQNIAGVTLGNIAEYFAGKELTNQV